MEKVKKKEEGDKKDEKRKRRGMKALKEIKKFQSSTKLLIWKLPFQRLVQEILQMRGNHLKIQGMAVKVPQEVGGCLLLGSWNKQICAPYMQSVSPLCQRIYS